jgi:hypothetical protein
LHTDVSLLGQIAAAAEAKNLVASHLSPATRAFSPTQGGGKHCAIAPGKRLGGGMTLGADLMQIPVAKQ